MERRKKPAQGNFLLKAVFHHIAVPADNRSIFKEKFYSRRHADRNQHIGDYFPRISFKICEVGRKQPDHPGHAF